MYVEVLDRHGDVRSRQRVQGATFAIGRSYDNDLILDDPFVSPHHLRISVDESGRMRAVDLDSLNGLHAVPGGQRVDSIDVTEDARVRIGHTQLRFRSRSFDVAETLPVLAGASPVRQAAAFYVAFLAASGMLALEAHLSTFGETQPAQLIAAVLGVLLSAFAWTGAWSFAGRVATRRANFYAHGTAVMAALVALLLVNDLSEYLDFMIAGTLAEIFLQLSIATIVAALLYRQLRLVSRVSARRAGISVVALVLVLFGSGWLVEYSTDLGFSGRLEYAASLKAPMFRLSRGLSPEAFVDQAQGLREELQALRTQH